MLKKHPFIFGTFILTITGFLSRIIGFFFRIFLSQTIGEEGMGIYQLLSPVMVLSFSITAAGIQTAISKFVASEPTTHDYKSSMRFLLVGFTISMFLSLLVTFILYQNSAFLAKNILLEARCEPLIRLFALSVPFAAAHSCINGYYYGIKNAVIPSISQLSEQICRVLSIYVIYHYLTANHLPVKISIAVIGLIIGEFVSFAISAIAILYRFEHLHIPFSFYGRKETVYSAKKISGMALPLCANRIVINILQSIEAIYIPNRLMLYGLSNEKVLSIYGVLTGMALPLILFPNALTGSISVLLLPYVSEAQANKNNRNLASAIHKCMSFGLLLGFICTGFFFLFGQFLGAFLFDSELAGSFIKSMSFICPFLYLSTVLNSVLHGLGKAGISFLFNSLCLGIRLLFVFILIPSHGILGYLWGLLVSEIVLCALDTAVLLPYITGNGKSSMN